MEKIGGWVVVWSGNSVLYSPIKGVWPNVGIFYILLIFFFFGGGWEEVTIERYFAF